MSRDTLLASFPMPLVRLYYSKRWNASCVCCAFVQRLKFFKPVGNTKITSRCTFFQVSVRSFSSVNFRQTKCCSCDFGFRLQEVASIERVGCDV